MASFLDLLEQSEQLTASMLTAAKVEDWETVASQERERRGLLVGITEGNKGFEYRQRIQRLLDTSLQIAALAGRRREEIAELLSIFEIHSPNAEQ